VIYELRRYQTRPGRRDDWVRYMEDVVIPFQAGQGVSVVASFIDEEDPDGYVWIRRFDDETQRAQQYAAVYQSEHWTTEIAPRVEELLLKDRSVITHVAPTPGSGLQ